WPCPSRDFKMLGGEAVESISRPGIQGAGLMDGKADGRMIRDEPRGEEPLAHPGWMDPALPLREGLYDPRHEHDSCAAGFVADMKNHKSHEIVEKGLAILRNLEHRGAVGADPKAGDGCGMLVQIPHVLLSEECTKLGIKLPAPGDYAVGHIFLPRDPEG